MYSITVTGSCTNDNNYMISSYFIPIKYICVEATALSNLLNSYEVTYAVLCRYYTAYVITDNSKDSLLYKFLQ